VGLKTKKYLTACNVDWFKKNIYIYFIYWCVFGVYLVFKVTINYEKLHQDNGRSTERYVILRDTVKLYKILEIVVISTARDNNQEYTNNIGCNFITLGSKISINF
jgi:hypothetical protein